MLLGSHLGSFDLMMLKNKVLHDRPITVLMHIDERSRVRRIAGIDDRKVPIIPLGSPRQLPACLRSAGARRHRRRARGSEREARPRLPSEFLGRPAPFPIGPHALAARAGASVLMGFGLYEGGATYRIEFIEFGPAAPAGSRGAALQPAVDRYVGAARAVRPALPEELVQLLSLLAAAVSLFEQDPLSALDAITAAQRLAFAPLAFHATAVMRDRGVLAALSKAAPTDWPSTRSRRRPACRPMPRACCSRPASACTSSGGGTSGSISARSATSCSNDEMTRVNFDFSRDVCYRAAAHLDEALTGAGPRA